MKMQLCAAKLVNADVLLLDKATGHRKDGSFWWFCPDGKTQVTIE